MQTIGWLRSALTHGLAEVVRNDGPACVELGHHYPTNGVFAVWEGGGPSFLGYAKTDAEARRLLGQAKRAELRLLYKLSSNCRAQKARLNHSPNGPSLIFPKAKAEELP